MKDFFMFYSATYSFKLKLMVILLLLLIQIKYILRKNWWSLIAPFFPYFCKSPLQARQLLDVLCHQCIVILLYIVHCISANAAELQMSENLGKCSFFFFRDQCRAA